MAGQARRRVDGRSTVGAAARRDRPDTSAAVTPRSGRSASRPDAVREQRICETASAAAVVAGLVGGLRVGVGVGAVAAGTDTVPAGLPAVGVGRPFDGAAQEG